MSLIVWIVVGALAGWIAGKVVRGTGFGFFGDVVVGIAGSVVAGWLLPRLGIPLGYGLIREILEAAVGAIVLLLVVRLLKRL